MDFLYVDVLLRCHWRCRLCMCSKRLAGEVGLEKCFSTQRMRVSITPVTERSVSVLLCFAVCLLPTCCAVAKLRTWMKRSNRNSEYLNYCIDAYKCKFDCAEKGFRSLLVLCTWTPPCPLTNWILDSLLANTWSCPWFSQGSYDRSWKIVEFKRHIFQARVMERHGNANSWCDRFLLDVALFL